MPGYITSCCAYGIIWSHRTVDSKIETPGACLVTSCCVWEPLSKNGVVMRPRRANGQNAAFGSHRPSPSITCHVGRPRTHYCLTKSNICQLVSWYCEANQLASSYWFVQLSPPGRWEVLQDYYYIKGILYYVLVYTLLVYHGTHFAFEPDGRRYHVGEILSVPMPSCPSYPCERLMLLLSHQKWHLKYEAAKRIILMTKTHISSTTEINASSLHIKMIIRISST